ncbi:MAG: ribonuclease HII, partial [Actinobacteria bacterium]|nr:ribonuclease HII [Actinomycetota bacterium]
MTKRLRPWPDASRERGLFAAGARTIVGIDEVGKGSWAGPLVIGIAMLREETLFADEPALVLGGVRDSKQLTEMQREELFEVVAASCWRWSTGAASAQECDQLGMVGAQKLATSRGFAALGAGADAAIVDGRWDFVSPHARQVVVEVKADTTCVSVAAASVLAKVSRDREMRGAARDYPHWHFDTNKGYPCA